MSIPSAVRSRGCVKCMIYMHSHTDFDGRQPSVMAKDKETPSALVEQFFYGSVTVGERGQVVIPAKARRDYGIECGDQLLIMGHPTKNGLMIAKVDAIRAFLSKMIDDLKFIESQQSSQSLTSGTDAHVGDPVESLQAQENH